METQELTCNSTVIARPLLAHVFLFSFWVIFKPCMAISYWVCVCGGGGGCVSFFSFLQQTQKQKFAKIKEKPKANKPRTVYPLAVQEK
uniref:Uncharacterized protein n=1 Tax=Rhizophora mucronata TaxID=61149 RepID=A0A2P2M225_RHIMU